MSTGGAVDPRNEQYGRAVLTDLPELAYPKRLQLPLPVDELQRIAQRVRNANNIQRLQCQLDVVIFLPSLIDHHTLTTTERRQLAHLWTGTLPTIGELCRRASMMTKVDTSRINIDCLLCNEAPETIEHVASCRILDQHNMKFLDHLERWPSTWPRGDIRTKVLQAANELRSSLSRIILPNTLYIEMKGVVQRKGHLRNLQRDTLRWMHTRYRKRCDLVHDAMKEMATTNASRHTILTWLRDTSQMPVELDEALANA
jgi:hypothetical protein